MIIVDIILRDKATHSPKYFRSCSEDTDMNINIKVIIEDKNRLDNTTYEFVHLEVIEVK